MNRDKRDARSGVRRLRDAQRLLLIDHELVKQDDSLKQAINLLDQRHRSTLGAGIYEM